MIKGDVIPDLPATRPQTIAAARGLIGRVFEENGWDAGEQRRFICSVGYDADLVYLSAAGVRDVLARMESSKMILFRK